MVKLNREQTVPIDTKEEFIEEVIITDNNSEEVIKENIILKAKQDAEKLIIEAGERAAQLLEQAKKDAMFAKLRIEEEGRQQGYQEGFQQGSEESKKLLIQAKTELENARKERERIINDIEPKVVDLIIKISEKVLGTTIKTNKNSIKYLLQKGLLEVKNTSDKITVRVSEDDYLTVLDNKKEIFEDFSLADKIDIVKDLSLEIGDCIIETQFGNIDCSLGVQFEGLKQELLFILSSNEFI